MATFPYDIKAQNALFLLSCTTSLDARACRAFNERRVREGKQPLPVDQNAQSIIKKIETEGVRFGLDVARLIGAHVAENRPLLRPECPQPLISDFDLRLNEGMLARGENWLDHYRHYAEKTKCGVLIVAGTVEWFKVWRESEACLEEVRHVPDGRLFAYIDGMIVEVSAGDSPTAVASVRDGEGYLVWSQGSIYQGQIRDGDKNGRGTYHYADGSVYDGEYVDGKRNGRGTEHYASGGVYDGEFVNDKKHGRGKSTYANGNVYDGEFADGNPHGRGKLTVADGNVFEGQYVHGKKHGAFTAVISDGRRWRGPFRNDEPFWAEGVWS